MEILNSQTNLILKSTKELFQSKINEIFSLTDNNWQLKQLGDSTEIITKGTTPTSVGFDFEDDGVNFIKVESITSNGVFLENKFAHISNDAHQV